MSLLPLFQWLGQTWFGVAMRESTWGFAIVEMLHLLALAGLGGAVLIVDLSLLGVGMKRQPVSHIARQLSPLLLGSLIVMLISGVLLLSEEATRCYYHPAFRVKMLLLVMAITFYFTIHRKIIRTSEDRPASHGAKLAAILSLALWLGVGLAGRAIGLI